jgi:hypothetical protein
MTPDAPQSDPFQQHYTVKDFCGFFRVSRTTVHEHIKARDLSVVNVALPGGKSQPRIPASEISRWYDAHFIPRRT